MPIPSILLTPPWEKVAEARARSKAAAKTMTDAWVPSPPAIEDAIVWGKVLGRPSIPWGSKKDESPELDAEVMAEAKTRGVSYVRLFDASTDTMLRILEEHPAKVGGNLDGLVYLMARLHAHAIPYVLRVFREKPFDALPYVLALQSAEIAPVAAEAWHKKKKLKMDGGRWLIRHPEVASLVLLPTALARKQRKPRDAALAALAIIEAEEPVAFERALEYYGDEARAGWKTAREEAPREGEPERAPPAPPFLAELTPPRLRDGDEPLPETALRNLCGLLALSPHPSMHPAMPEILEACTKESLQAFARSLFDAWTRSGLSREHGYAARYAIHLGDDDLIAEVADLAAEWGSSGGYARAIWVVDALAENASSMLALSELDHLRRARSWSLAFHARSKLHRVAESRGMTTDELADVLVPDLGLGKPWSSGLTPPPTEEGYRLVLANDQLALEAPSGQRLQKPSAREAQAAFGALAKQVRTALGRQRTRLESAMLDGRVWRQETFASLIAHPLLGPLARRLVWIMKSASHSPIDVRVAEDGSLADRSDTTIKLDAGSTFTIAHPVELGERIDEWRIRMAEYELIEPISQLGREVFTPEKDAKTSLALEAKVDAKRLAGIARRGWSAGEVEEGGYIHTLTRTVRDASATLILTPGLLVGAWSSSEPQEVTVDLSKMPQQCPVLYSEVRRDLALVTEPAR